MLKIYCTECGSPTNYSASKPKFCSNCGKSFDNTVVNKSLYQKPTTTKPIDVEVDDDFDDPEDDISTVNKVPSIRRLDVEMDQFEVQKQKTKIGDIVGSAKTGAKREKIENKKLTKSQMAEERKKFLESFKREAGSIRGKSRGPRDG